METFGTVGPGGLGWADVGACTLPTAERPLRVAEFNALFRAALRSIAPGETDTRVRLLLSGGTALVARVQRLADAESSCCSFFAFEVAALSGELVAFDVEVPTAHADVLAGLADQARAALDRAS